MAHWLILMVVLALAGCSRETLTRPSPPAVPPFTPAPAPPMPRMVDEGVPLTVLPDPAGFRLHGRVRNDGDACGTRIEGRWFFSSRHEISWTIDPAVILRPGELAPYEACCLPLSVAGQTLTYTGLLKADPIVCP